MKKCFSLPVFCFLLIGFTGCKKDFQSGSVVSSSDAQIESVRLGKPNIVIILADDIGYDAIGRNGNQTFETPNIDRMGQNGMSFTQCYGSPLCSPSRTAFISGKYNFRNYTEWGVFDTTGKTFANIAKKAGYATFVAGKWSFDGGDASAHSMGFDGYSLWDAIKEGPPGRHYKDPKIYENGTYLQSSFTNGKYGDDIFTSRVLSFINANKGKNFFVFFPITLCHGPYSPTPDDPEFAMWDSKSATSDPKYFPSMIKYMDKKVGQIIDSLKQWNLYNNTIVMFSGDNGTPHDIFYYYRGQLREGGKSGSTEAGTHVPLFVTWPNAIAPGTVNPNLIEFQDLLPTVAEAMGVTITSDYGTIDGLSFYPQLIGANTQPRKWIFNHYQPFTNKGNDRLKRWIQNITYKLYDSTGKFYNILLDRKEQNPIWPADRTDAEKRIVNNFQSIMDGLK
ncbi:MAG TPA: sulfatase-like hydrolase/transferase [Chitinophagaceae bacterium]|nr:sulfatase-like hydrolase/transferase [Chitinophagaceae bacterium]